MLEAVVEVELGQASSALFTSSSLKAQRGLQRFFVSRRLVFLSEHFRETTGVVGDASVEESNSND